MKIHLQTVGFKPRASTLKRKRIKLGTIDNREFYLIMDSTGEKLLAFEINGKGYSPTEFQQACKSFLNLK